MLQEKYPPPANWLLATMMCVCVASVLAPVLEEEEEWKERKQQWEIRNNRGEMESVLPVKTFV